MFFHELAVSAQSSRDDYELSIRLRGAVALWRLCRDGRAMDLMTLQNSIEEYRAREEAIVTRQKTATTDRQRFELERMRRLIQVVIVGLLDRTKREISRDHSGRTERAPVRSQTAA